MHRFSCGKRKAGHIDCYYKVTFMYVIATSNEKFAARWMKISGSKVTVRLMDSIATLLDFLPANPVDLIVLDMNLPGARDSEILKKIASLKNQARLIFGGISFTPAAELASLAIGAVACCPPTLGEAECRKILSVVSKKGVWLSSAGIPALMARLHESAIPAKPDARQNEETGSFAAAGTNPLNGLTRREVEIARLINKGCSNKAVAKELDIAERTVKAHLSSIFEKLDVKDRLQLVVLMSGHV